MAIKSVYNKYFQKSKVFLYPLLGIKRGAMVIPSETYLAWDDTIKVEDMKLVCLYHPKQNDEYSLYENKILLKHNRLHDIRVIDNNNKLFIFDFSDLKDDWNHFINGRYSKLNSKIKGKIKGFFDVHSANYVYMSSYLYPDKYFEDYAECLNIEIEIISDVGELCSKPNLEKEKLLTEQIKLENKEIIN